MQVRVNGGMAAVAKGDEVRWLIGSAQGARDPMMHVQRPCRATFATAARVAAQYRLPDFLPSTLCCIELTPWPSHAVDLELFRALPSLPHPVGTLESGRSIRWFGILMFATF